MPTDEEWEGMGRKVDMHLETLRARPEYIEGYDDGLQAGEARGWEAGKKAVLKWLRNEDIEHDPDDLYTGRAHRVAAVEKLKRP